MVIDKDGLTMDDGETYYANRGILGLTPELGLTQGYDGGFHGGEMPEKHRREIAAYMIRLWTRVLNGEQEKHEW